MIPVERRALSVYGLLVAWAVQTGMLFNPTVPLSNVPFDAAWNYRKLNCSWGVLTRYSALTGVIAGSMCQICRSFHAARTFTAQPPC